MDSRHSKAFSIILGGVEGGSIQGIAPSKLTGMQAHCGDKGEGSHEEILAAGPKEKTDRERAVSGHPGGTTELQGSGNVAGPSCRA